jgi:hypothetical protein
MKNVMMAVLVVGLMGCSKKEAPSWGPVPSTSTVVAAAPVAKKADTIDAPQTIKNGNDVQVMFSNASTVGKSVITVFGLKNDGDQEKHVSSMLSFQATTIEGTPGKLDLLKSKCDGSVPPHGKFMCALKFDFPDGPTELNIKAEGAWFHIKTEQK